MILNGVEMQLDVEGGSVTERSYPLGQALLQ